MREEPRPFQIYKHFKGTYYQVLCVARQSETEEKLVIYKPLFEGDDVYARPLEMFLSDVDHDKYPGIKQRYRFALVTGQHRHNAQNDGKDAEDGSTSYPKRTEEDFSDASPKDELLDAFLDAQSSEEKLDILTGGWKTITEENIDNIAVVLDMELTGSSLEEKYKEILNCLKIRARYESSRLR